MDNALLKQSLLKASEVPLGWVAEGAGASGMGVPLAELASVPACEHTGLVRLEGFTGSDAFGHSAGAPPGGAAASSSKTLAGQMMGVESFVWQARNPSRATDFVKELSSHGAPGCLQQLAGKAGHPLPGIITLGAAPKVGSASVAFDLSYGTGASSSTPGSSPSPAGAPHASAAPSTPSPMTPYMQMLASARGGIAVFASGSLVIAVFSVSYGGSYPTAAVNAIIKNLAAQVAGAS